MTACLPTLPQEIQLRIIDFALDGDHHMPLLFGIARTKSIAINLALVCSAFLNQIIPVCQRRLCRVEKQKQALEAQKDDTRSLIQQSRFPIQKVSNEIRASLRRGAQLQHLAEERVVLQALINRFSKVLQCINEPEEFDQALDEASFSTADMSFADGTLDDPVVLD